MIFRDRRHAGRVLAQHLGDYAHRFDVVVLALPRGGVPVAYEVALAIEAPLDVFVVRKLGVPGYSELAMGAIASGGLTLLSSELIAQLGISQEAVETAIAREAEELARRERLYRRNRPALDVAGKTVILVDDGLATGATMRAAVAAVRKLGPKSIVVAVPTAASESCAELRSVSDGCVCVTTPEYFRAVGEWYVNFDQTTDDEVRQLIEDAAADRTPAAPAHVP